MKKELIEKGEKIIDELNINNNSSLNKWMAHYIAELIENSKLDQELYVTDKECADLIIQLWDMKIQEQIMELKSKNMDWFNRIYDNKNDEYYKELRALLSNDKHETQGVLIGDFGITLTELSSIEVNLVRLFEISKGLNTTEEEVSDEAKQLFQLLESETKMVYQQVIKIFPEFEDISVENLAIVKERVVKALQSIDKVRHQILWE